MHLIIDADPIVYRAGFASEETSYWIVTEDKEGNLMEAVFNPELDAEDDRITAGAQMKSYLDGKEMTVVAKERLVNPEPIENCLQAVSSQLKSIVRAACEKLKAKPELTQVTVLLSGPGNYRDALATIRPYKGNRDPEHKPFHYQAIRDYLVQAWSARVVTGREADDEVSILARQHFDAGELDSFVIATIDKDLDQVPGWHYNYQQHVSYYVGEQDAADWFWKQVLSGDTTDNIAGCYKIGPTKAERLVNEWRKQGVSDEGIWLTIVDMYNDSQRVAGCPYVGQDGRALALENARLVYMQRVAGELWTPPGEPAQWLKATADD